MEFRCGSEHEGGRVRKELCAHAMGAEGHGRKQPGITLTSRSLRRNYIAATPSEASGETVLSEMAWACCAKKESAIDEIL